MKIFISFFHSTSFSTIFTLYCCNLGHVEHYINHSVTSRRLGQRESFPHSLLAAKGNNVYPIYPASDKDRIPAFRSPSDYESFKDKQALSSQN